MNVSTFNDKFLVQELTIYESQYWIWSLRPHQVTLGSGILSLKRECKAFSDITFDESGDLQEVIKVIEKSLSIAFKYDVINYLMLMMVDKHLHFHVVPRYSRPIELLGEEWVDGFWPGIPVLAGEQTGMATLRDIAEHIRARVPR